MRRFFLVCVALSALAPAPALATTPTPVAIEVQTIFANGFGTFTTSGAGLCPGGTTTDVGFASGFQSPNHINFHVRKTFTCADGSGTFTALVQGHFVFGSPSDSFEWTIVTGTGAYADLHGDGSGVGDELPAEVDDHFTGSVHFD
jgi:hypothetical protein